MRVETDSLGPLKIPDDAYYGIQSFRASQNFPISQTQVHPALIRSYLLLKKAAAKANNAMKEVDLNLHRAQMRFIQRHFLEIDEGQQTAARNEQALQAATVKLQKLAENMHGQIRLLNF